MRHNLSKPRPVSWQNELLNNINNGYYKIPKFQRDFVWNIDDAAKLVDSVIKGYPIGTFILWRTKERFNSIKEIGGHKFPEPNEGSEIYYVLDGQQRITSLYCALNGLKVVRSKKSSQDFSNLYVDLNFELDTNEQLVRVQRNNEELSYLQVPLKLIAAGTSNEEFTELSLEIGKINKPAYNRLNKIMQQIQTGYNFSIIEVDQTPIEIATEMFTRINVTGKQLSIFEIMCAKTYIETKNDEIGFDLYHEYEELIKKLDKHGFGTIQSSAILQAASAIIVGKIDKKSILSIDRYEFQSQWKNVNEAICNAIIFLKQNLGVSASKLIPYDALIVPFAYYFSHSKYQPNGKTKSYLETLFWHTSLSEAYSGSSNEEIGKDIQRIKVIISGDKPEFTHSKAKLINSKKIETHGEFKPNRSFIKAILCAYAKLNPRSIYNGAEIMLSNDYLSKSNSRQYHHFFPKGSFKDMNVHSEWAINNIVNIVYIESDSNKRISSKLPEEYMKTCSIQNSEFDLILSTNLLPIYKTNEPRYYEDFDFFVEQRRQIIVNAMRSMIKSLD